MSKTNYEYKECGLDNIILAGLDVRIDDDGDECITIPNVNALHKVIAGEIIRLRKGMNGKQLRFLRTLMGKTQAELADEIHKDRQAIARWEKGECPIDPNAETVIRMLANDELGTQLNVKTREVSGWCIQTSDPQTIRIDASNPDNYRPLAA